MSRIRPILFALAAIAAINCSIAPPANAIKAREAVERAGSHCEVFPFLDDGKPSVMIICGTFPDQDVIFCKGDAECYVSHAPVQSVPTTRKPELGVAVSDAQQTPPLETVKPMPQRLPKRLAKETGLAYIKRIGFIKVSDSDAIVRKALPVKQAVVKPVKIK